MLLTGEMPVCLVDGNLSGGATPSLYCHYLASFRECSLVVHLVLLLCISLYHVLCSSKISGS